MNELIVRQLANSSDWSAFKLGDLSEAIRSLVVLTLKGPVDPEVVDYWRGRCDSEIDFLVYSFALVDVRGAADDPAREVDELVHEWAPNPLGITSKRNLLPVYLNTYFFKYIASVELPKLHGAMTNSGLTPEQCIDFYITHLLYGGVVEENPGVFFTYEQIPGIDPGRVSALQQIRNDLVRDIGQIGTEQFASLLYDLRSPFWPSTAADAQDLTPVFKSVFLLMTYYVGSNYRRLHDAVTTLLAVDTAEFRNTFFQNLPSIIQHHGGLLPQISSEAILDEVKAVATDARKSSVSTSARVEVHGSTQGGFINPSCCPASVTNHTRFSQQTATDDDDRMGTMTPMQQRLIDLAIQARGKKSRPEALSLMDELSLNSYYNFENGKVWPQSANLRKIEEALSLTPGIMTELAGSGQDPQTVTLEVLRGERPLAPRALSGFTDEELLLELIHRFRDKQKEIGRLSALVAGSRDEGMLHHGGDESGGEQ